MSKFSIFIISLFAGILTFFAFLVVPNNYFANYELKLNKTARVLAASNVIFEDMDNDGQSEKFDHFNINLPEHSLDIRKANKLLDVFVFPENEKFISQKIQFANLNQNKNKELVFLTITANKVFLNILEFDTNSSTFKLLDKCEVDTFNYYSDLPDVNNTAIQTKKDTIYFDLQAGYSILPRAIYRYTFSDKKIIKTKTNSIASYNFKLFEHNHKSYILPGIIYAAGNSISYQDYQDYLKSENQDTLKIAHQKQNKIYKYGDFASYILFYTTNLNFAFEPIEFKGWTNYTLSETITIKNEKHIVSLTYSQKENGTPKTITLSSLQGQIKKQIAVKKNFFSLYSDQNKLVFAAKDTLYVYSNRLKPIKILSNISHAIGFYDINKDGLSEFVAFKNNQLIVFSNNFENKTIFEIPHEYSVYPVNKDITILSEKDESDFEFTSKNFLYFFSYKKNKFSALKIPFFALVFIFWFLIICFFMKLNNKRLEKEKLKLEELIQLRTSELKASNKILEEQKLEIMTQAKELDIKNQHLEKINIFKATLTHTLIHDLKNPLSQILLKTSDKDINHLSNKMLRLIKNLLDVDKYQETELKIKASDFELHNILEALQTTFSVSLQQKNIFLSLPEKKALITAEKDLIVRVFENIVSNAIKYSPQNKTIEISIEQVNSNTIKIGIKNSGKPIPKNEFPFIFDKFKSFNNSISKNETSSGLGLNFCKMVLEAHGHSIQAVNEKQAVVFVFTLSGKIIQGTKKNHIQENKIILSEEEKKQIEPYLKPLFTVNIYEISKALLLINQIPEKSKNITLLKHQLENACYSSNKELFTNILAQSKPSTNY